MTGPRQWALEPYYNINLRNIINLQSNLLFSVSQDVAKNRTWSVSNLFLSVFLRLLEELLNKFKSSMKLQLNCFKPASFQPVKR